MSEKRPESDILPGKEGAPNPMAAMFRQCNSASLAKADWTQNGCLSETASQIFYQESGTGI